MHKNLPRNVIVRLPHPRSGDTQGQETMTQSSQIIIPSNRHNTLGLIKW